jgi:uncharacterized protein (UPF0264 family)
MTGLLISVRSAAEAALALAGGVALIDVKEPQRGSLGPADEATVGSVLDFVAERCPVSAALGELRDWVGGPVSPLVARLHYVKWGLASAPHNWEARLRTARAQVESSSRCQVVAALYADHRRARAPSPREVCHVALANRFAGLLLDTCIKDGTTLLDWMAVSEVEEILEICHGAGLKVALAGGLGPGEIRTLLPARPDWFAVRGAVCHRSHRTGEIDPERITELVQLLA